MKILIGYTKNNKRILSDIVKNENDINKSLEKKYHISDLSVLRDYDIINLTDDLHYFFLAKDSSGMNHLQISKPISINDNNLTVEYTDIKGRQLTDKIKYDDILGFNINSKLNFDKLTQYGYKGKFVIVNDELYKYFKKRPKIKLSDVIVPRNLIHKTKKEFQFEIKRKELNRWNDKSYDTIVAAKYFFIYNKEKTKKLLFKFHSEAYGKLYFYNNSRNIQIKID